MKPVRVIVLAVLLNSFCHTAGIGAEGAVGVEGRLTGAGGAPLAGCYVSPNGLGWRERITTDDDGRFRFEVERPGGYFCWFAAPKHKTAVIPLLLSTVDSMTLDVRLEVIDTVDPIDSVSVIGDFNDFDREDGLVPMARQADGTWRARVEVDGDSLAYQLMGVQTRDYPVSGTQEGRRVFDYDRPLHGGAGAKYITVIPADDGAAEVVFDPGRLPRDPAPFEARCSDATADAVMAAGQEIERLTQDFIAAYTAYSETQGDPRDFSYDWSESQQWFRDRLASERDPAARDYLLVRYFQFGPTRADSALARRVVEEVPPDSPVWSLVWGGPMNVWSTIARIAAREQQTRRYGEQVIEAHADPDVRAGFVYQALVAAKTRGDADEQRRLYMVLIGEYPDHWLADMARRSLAPDLDIEAGKPVPDFRFTPLHGKGDPITAGSLRGRVYLIDFWAVWCKPCVAEMGVLHEAYERYHDRGFTILSVSFDRKPDDVDEFRDGKWPMPWLHTHVPFDQAEPLRVTFEIAGIPRPILVGPDGTILAAGTELRGDGLLEAVGRAFEGGNPEGQ